MALVLVAAWLCRPSSEPDVAERFYRQSALPDLLGIPAGKVEEHRLYRALDAALPHKEALERLLRDQIGTLFGLEYDLLLYDVTSTYFEGRAEGNRLARRGYSRDHRRDCKQVCIGLVVTRCGMPLGYEVFAGNRSDGTTLGEMVERTEGRYGRAERIWIMDRGMGSEKNVAWLKAGALGPEGAEAGSRSAQALIRAAARRDRTGCRSFALVPSGDRRTWRRIQPGAA